MYSWNSLWSESNLETPSRVIVDMEFNWVGRGLYISLQKKLKLCTVLIKYLLVYYFS